MGRNARLADSQINGIQSLVAGSVENLEPESVTVIDHNGQITIDTSSGGTAITIALPAISGAEE